MKKLFALILIISVMTSAFSMGKAEESFPDQPFEMTVQWSAGGGADLVMRALSDVFEKYSGQPLMIKNVPGAAGVPGTVGFLETASPDGYSLLHWSNAHVSKYHMSKDIPFNSFSMKHICQIVESTHYILVNADSPWQDFESFISYVKDHPDEVRMGNAGIGGGNHLAACLLESEAGISFKHVAYEGGGPSVIGLMSGEVDAVICNSPEGYGNIDAGQIRMLVSFGSERLEGYEDVPTAKELGYPIELKQWRGVAVPAETPDEIVDKLDDILKQCIEDESFQKRLRDLGVTPHYRETEEYIDFILSEEERFKALIKEKKLGNRYTYAR